MKSNPQYKEEVIKLAYHTATRILDALLEGRHTIGVDEEFSATELLKDLEKGNTRDMVFHNLKDFDDCLNCLIRDRLDYLFAEAFLIIEDDFYRAQSKKELALFLNV